ncbi:MAG: NlpC/P60 family protein, partial [Rickettsiales bacterium]
MVIQRRCFLKYTAIVALLVFITIRLFPVIYDSLRIAEIVALFIFLAAAFAYGFHHTAIRVLLGASLLIALYFAFFPARPYSEEKLRKGYVSALESYLNTPYVWGGERFTGMDCSGLIRVGLAKAALYEGLQTLNPGLVRNAVQLWMEDTTAKG